MQAKVEITNHDPVADNDRRPSGWRLTLDITAQDDPHGNLWGLALSQAFGEIFKLYGQGDDVTVADDAELWALLTHGSKAARHLSASLASLIWAARDTHGLSWGTLAAATDQGRKSVRNLVERTRDDYASGGYWRDETGLHSEAEPQVAMAKASLRASELASRRTTPGHAPR